MSDAPPVNPRSVNNPEETSTARDLQREALHDLVLLSTECADTEETLERRRQTEQERVEAQLRKDLEDAGTRYQAEREAIACQYEEFLQKIAATYESDRARLDAAQEAKRLELNQEHATAEGEIKKKYTHAAWLAETVLEGVQEQTREEARKAKEELANRRQLIEQLEGQAEVLMFTLRQEWTPVEWIDEEDIEEEDEAVPGLEGPLHSEVEDDENAVDVDVDPAPDQEQASPSRQSSRLKSGGTGAFSMADKLAALASDAAEPRRPEAPFDALYEEAGARLEATAGLRFPRLFVGVAPFVLILLAMLAGAGVAQLLAGLDAPHVKEIAIGAGVGLVAMLAAGAGLRSVARTQVQRAADGLREAIERAARSAQAEFAHGQWARQRRLAEAYKKRDHEVQEAKTRFGPLLAKAVREQEEFLKGQQAERERLLAKIEAQREASLGEAERWRAAMLAEVEERHQREQREARERHEQALVRIRNDYEAGRRELEQRWRTGLAQIQEPIDGRQRGLGQAPLDWESPEWQGWKPPRQFTSVVRFGEMKVDLKQITERVPGSLALPEEFAVPALLAFPKQASLLVASDHTGRAEAIRVLRMVMMRLLVSLPAGRVRFTIIDPVGLGQNFAGFMHLADYDESLVGNRIWTESDHIERRLADLTEHMETVIQKYLRNEFPTIDAYNAQAGELAEPYRFLVIADFPLGFSEDALRRLASIIGTGARCGVYTLIARDTRQPLPPGVTPEELAASSVSLVHQKDRFVWEDEVFKRFPLMVDPPPSEEFLTRTLHVIGREARESKRVEVPFESIAPTDDRMWSRSTDNDVEVPIGRMGASRLQMLRLGRGVAQHGLIAGKTGSGKSTLLHVLITNLALWYSPEEVEFYLVDFKKGVEFKAYATHRLPHARAVAVESDREFGLSVLQRVDAELGRRGEMFRKLGVQDLASYRQASGRKLPRTLLIIDEFQEFFSEDDRIAQDASLLLDRLVRQGRAFGIHLLLGSQTIGGTSGLARSTIGQMAVRVALQTSEADSQVILGDGNSAARLLSRPGEAIYNDMSGLVEANSPFQVSWLPDEGRDKFLERVREKAEREGLLSPKRERGISIPEMVVFEGNVPADIRKNSLLAALLDKGGRASCPPGTGETHAPHEAGKMPAPHEADKMSAPRVEAPRVWLGEPVAIKEPTAVTLRRQSGANVLIIGQQEESGLALLASSLISLAAQHAPDAAKFYVLDGSPSDSPLATVFPRLKDVVPHEVRLVEYRAVPEAINEVAEELAQRQSSEDLNLPAVYVLIYGLQRYRVLRRQEDSFSFSPREEDAKPAPDRQFADLLREGPPVGMHVVAWCDTPAAVERTLDRASLREFDNRILFQMSASDSSNLIDSPLANKLGQNRALAYSEEHGTLEKFRPYALPDAEWLQSVRERLASRSENSRTEN